MVARVIPYPDQFVFCSGGDEFSVWAEADRADIQIIILLANIVVLKHAIIYVLVYLLPKSTLHK